MNTPLMEVRAALTSTSNTTGGDARTGVGGVEIQKIIDNMIVDSINRATEFLPLVNRKPMNPDQLIYQWNIRTSLGDSSKAAFYSDGATGTSYFSEKIQCFVQVKSIRSDYAVTGLMDSASSAFYSALEDEANDAISQLNLLENQSMINGDDATVGVTSAYKGLYQLLGNNATWGETGTIYNHSFGDSVVLDSKVVSDSDSNLSNPISLGVMNKAITASNKAGNSLSMSKIFLMSFERRDQFEEQLQPQQRFNDRVEVAGGFKVPTYKGYKVIAERRMSYTGVTWNGGTLTRTDTDRAAYFLDMDNIDFRVLNGVDKVHVPIMGNDTSIRKDERGGYFKTYGVFVVKRFDTQVVIYNLDALTAL